MIRKTYGVSGLMDWATQIKVGKATVMVHFTGGALTAFGVTPATYTTTDPFFQKVIEGSDYFKNGRITLLSGTYIGDDPVVKDEREAESEPTANAGEATAASTGDDVATIEVADKYDAIEYLKENFPTKNYTSSNLRTKTAFEAACKECGVVFVFTA